MVRNSPDGAGMPPVIARSGLRHGLALAALLLANTAHAQVAIDRTELVLRPDSAARRSGVMIVRNTGRTRTDAVIRVEDWDRGADGAHRFFEAGTQPGSCASVLTVSPLEFTLAPGESRAVEVGLDGAVNSACWSLVLVESVETVTGADGQRVRAAVRTGMKVYAEPSYTRALGEVSDIEVEISEAAHTGAQAAAPRMAAVTFRNTGERHLRAEGRIEILRADDSVVAALPLPVLQTLPGGVMTARVALPAAVTGPVRLRARIDYGGASVAAAEREASLP